MLLDMPEAAQPLNGKARLFVWAQWRWHYFSLIDFIYGPDSTVSKYELHDFETTVRGRLGQNQFEFVSYMSDNTCDGEEPKAGKKMVSYMKELCKANGLPAHIVD